MRIPLLSGLVRRAEALARRAEAPLQKAAPVARQVVNEARDAFEHLPDYVAGALHPVRVWNDPALPVPPDRGGLKVTTFNVELGGHDVAAAAAYLREQQPDVVCLQEVSEATARQLGQQLGMHVAFAGKGALHLKYDKAILSKYPIEGAERVGYRIDTKARDAAIAARKAKGEGAGEIPEARSLLRATIQVGGRTVDLVDTHLSLGDTANNANEIDQLTDYMLALQRQGHTVVGAGDFNANFALAGSGAADPKGSLASPTDTVAEFKDRYSGVVGNMGDARVKAAADRLRGAFTDDWQAPERTVKVGGAVLTPEQARAELASGAVKPGSPRYLELMTAADGLSHRTAHKRFDNIFASRDVRVARTHLDLDTRASDHQPVTTELRWD